MSDKFIAGYHDIYWRASGASGASVILGTTGPEPTMSMFTPDVEIITGDNLGENTPIDGLYKGGSLVIEFIVQEIKLSSVLSLFQPFQQTAGTVAEGTVGVPGQLASISHIGRLEFVPRTGTPAASLYASGGNGRQVFGMHIGPNPEGLGTRQRVIPIRFQCFPFDDSGTLRWWKRITTFSAS